MLIFLLILALIFSLTPSREVWGAGEVYVFTKEKRGDFPPHFRIIEDPSELCKYQKIVIFGAEGFRVAQNYRCPKQKRFVAGILYLSHFFDQQYTYISPLPSPEFLKNLGSKFIVLESSILSFYLNDLEKFCILNRIKIKNWYDVERALREIKDEQGVLLLLPEPPLLDKRVNIIMKEQLTASKLKVLNFLGKSLGIRNEVVFTVPWGQYFREVERIYREDNFYPGKIYYLNY